MRVRQILFLDKSGFNLHTSINYNYSHGNHDAVIFQPKSRGKNISLCGIISGSGLAHYDLFEDAYDKTRFLGFLSEYNASGVLSGNPIVFMDNVRFYYCHIVEEYHSSLGVTVVFLPPYSPNLKSFENVFS